MRGIWTWSRSRGLGERGSGWVTVTQAPRITVRGRVIRWGALPWGRVTGLVGPVRGNPYVGGGPLGSPRPHAPRVTVTLSPASRQQGVRGGKEEEQERPGSGGGA